MKAENRKAKEEKMKHAKDAKDAKVKKAKEKAARVGQLAPVQWAVTTSEGLLLLTRSEFAAWLMWQRALRAQAERMRRGQ